MSTNMKVYMANRRLRRRNDLLALRGNKCKNCYSTEKLEFHHKDPTTKSFELSGCALDKSWIKILIELEKCNLLCANCHLVITNKTKTVGHGEGLTGKQNCYCGKCKPLKTAYMREWRSRNPRFN